jgi:branched-chain amino acid transport system substrate-binding protein
VATTTPLAAAKDLALAPNQLIPGVEPGAVPAVGPALPGVAPGQMPQRPAPDAAGLTRVGLLVPLTGQSAPVGRALLNAAQMALFDVADNRFILQAYDTQGTAEGAVEASAKALSHGVQLLLGPLFSGEVKAVSPQAAAAGVNIVAFSTDPAIAGPNVFVMGFLVQEQVRQIVAYADAKGLKRLAVLAPNSAYGQSAVEAFKQAVPARGGTVVDVAFYQPDGKDLNQVVRQIAAFDRRKQALETQKAELASKGDEASQLALKRLETQETAGDVEFDAILLPDQGVRLTQAATLLPFFDIDPGRVQLLGTLLWNTPGLGREPVMVGGVFPAPPPDSTRQFFARYREIYGQVPPAIATHGYDAVALAAVLARSDAPPGGVFSAEAMTAATGFAGIDGIFRFLPNGLSERGFAIMQVTRSGAAEVQPAPTTFEAAQF